ncbi:LysM peptidoglycan-binding domain-containing protein [Listeria costaricensis]|uniref:LysM peptidoglycan-binding domain-containing protein n=1 Tax=Listeria costaricensis TaxID=2026604 RepID=UPI000C083B61|nr:LysM peptidoglycan-binding domain-containing protein [Listeria costaricensis]
MAKNKRSERYKPSDDYGDEKFAAEEKDEFDNEPPMLSRSDSRRSRKKTIFRYPLLNILIVFFLLIPIVVIVVFMAVQYSGTSNQADQADSSIEVKKNTEKEQSEKEKAKKEQAEKEEAAKEKSEKEQAQKEADEKAAQEAETKKQQEEAAKQAEAEKQAQAEADKKAQEEAAAQAEKEAQEQAAKEKEEAQQSAGTHTVQAGDTLYSIAKSFYGSSGASAGVEKIKQANGLSSNNVPVGTTLTIPK